MRISLTYAGVTATIEYPSDDTERMGEDVFDGLIFPAMRGVGFIDETIIMGLSRSAFLDRENQSIVKMEIIKRGSHD